MFVFLDIGFTLLGGPSQGPAGRLMKHLGLPLDAKDPLNHLLFDTPLEKPEALADHIARDYGLKKENILPFIAELWDKQVHEAYPLPGAVAGLQRLREGGIPFGFISNIWAPFLAGFARCFPREFKECPLFASYQQGVAKPNLELFLIALRHMGLKPQETVMIGDTYAADMAPALELGMKTIWILTRPDKERFDLVDVLNHQKTRPHQTLASMEHLHPDQVVTLLSPSA
ncbi:MAG: HAD hydrolase-like protein [Magnetococcus sp. THC-1_WYH]